MVDPDIVAIAKFATPVVRLLFALVRCPLFAWWRRPRKIAPNRAGALPETKTASVRLGTATPAKPTPGAAFQKSIWKTLGGGQRPTCLSEDARRLDPGDGLRGTVDPSPAPGQ